MGHPEYLREKARSLRMGRRLSIDQISERLALPKTTIFYWVRDLPLERAGRPNSGHRKGNREMRRRYRVLREEAYRKGQESFAGLCDEPTFRDFVCLYVAEGYKRDRNRVSLGNSDQRVVLLAAHWIRRFARNPVTYGLQYHADQDLAELQRAWSAMLGVRPDEIRFQRKSNSGQLGRRQWRSRLGVLTVCANDTLLRARLGGWIDCLREEWLDSLRDGA